MTPQKTITLTKITECPHCGQKTDHINTNDLKTMQEWANTQNHYMTLRNRKNTNTGHTFTHGGNYDYLEFDLFGGDQHTEFKNRFQTETKTQITHAGNYTKTPCDYCTQYI